MALSQILAGFLRMATETRRYAGRLPNRVTLGAVWFVGIIFLLTNAKAIYGTGAEGWKNILMVYMLSLALFYGATDTKSQLFRVSVSQGVVVFVLAFSLAAFALFSLPFPSPSPQDLGTTSTAIILTHVLVVAVSEEALFRHAIPSMLPIPAYGAQFVSALIFGAFHWTAYGAVTGALLFAVVAGIVFGVVKESMENGLVAAIGFHAAWNLWSLGILAVAVGGGG